MRLWRILSNPRSQVYLAAVITVLVSTLAAFQTLHFWHHDLSDPYDYAGDSIITLTWVKGLTENPWVLRNQYLGAPGIQELHDFPLTSSVHFLAIRLLSYFNSNPFWLVNVYFLLTFPLAAISLWTLCRIAGVNAWIAAAFGILFACLPGHYWRNTAHLFLSAYFYLPLAMIPLVWMNQVRPYMFDRSSSGRLTLLWKDRRTWLTVMIAAAVGSDFVYSTYFTIILAIIASVSIAWIRGSRTTALAGMVYVSLTLMTFVANMAPTFIYHWENGRSTSPDHLLNHHWSEGEHYGLKIMSMILPIQDHPIHRFRKQSQEYYRFTPVRSEDQSMALGFFGSVGMIASLILLLRPNLTDERSRLLYLLGICTAMMILFGTISGFGTLTNLLHLRSARSYCRISNNIAVMALLTTAILSDQLFNRLAKRASLRLVLGLGICLAVPLGLADQTWHKSSVRVEMTHQATELKRADAEYFGRIQAVVPSGGSVYQLPQISLHSKTEGRGKMFHYDHYKAYLHTHGIRWSYGVIYGRSADWLHQFLDKQSPDLLVDLLLASSFDGIHLDRWGYADRGDSMSRELRRLLGDPLVEPRGRYEYFPLGEYRKNRMEQFGEEKMRATWQNLTRLAQECPRILWPMNAGAEIRTPEGQTSREIAGHFQVKLVNPSAEIQKLELRFQVHALPPHSSQLAITVPGHSDIFELGAQPREYARGIELPPGETVVELRIEASPNGHGAAGGPVEIRDFRLILPKNSLKTSIP